MNTSSELIENEEQVNIYSNSVQSFAGETRLRSASLHTNANEQVRSEELLSDLSTMKLLNNDEKNRLSNTLDSLESNSDLSSSIDRTRHSYKSQKQNYLIEKKRITNELAAVLRDPSVIVLADWLKVRGTLRDWTKLWVTLKPGLLLLYKRPLEKVGSSDDLLFSSCQVIQRPSKKPGFCFKIFHPLEKSIWSAKGPSGEAFGALTFPLPMTYLIFRASDENTGTIWLDWLEMTIKCGSLLKKPNDALTMNPAFNYQTTTVSGAETANLNTNLDDSDRLSEVSVESKASGSSSHSEVSLEKIDEGENKLEATTYIPAPPEEMGELGNIAQTEDVGEENKSLIFHLIKQVRPGMDLSKVVLPTFILEPRSFLEKLSDYYHHADLLEEAIHNSDPYTRMKTVIKFYLSGFYKKPKGLKKPYNPVIGELYRCYWHHSKSDSKTFYISEQLQCYVLPIGASKEDGHGNSVSAILDGSARLTLLNLGEDYSITLPYANCKVEGKIKLGKETLATIIGHWDDQIDIIDKATGIRSVLWKVNSSVVKSRLKRFVVPIEQQNDNESEKLWQRVTFAIRQNDQNLATEEKTLVEEQQRKQLKELKATGNEWKPHMFTLDPVSKEWIYLHADLRPWDPYNDIVQFESNFIISTQQRHHAPSYTSGTGRNNSTVNATSSEMVRGSSPSFVRERHSNNVKHNENDDFTVMTTDSRTSGRPQDNSHNDDNNSFQKYVENEFNNINQRITNNENIISDLKLYLKNRTKNNELINSLFTSH
ncbi:unnamed protein product [Didymodactylos carnosus]|uniref:PH domain-containing protein n=1 Tax=Didymodactylos carnosus TaxID=1234261 RepID=A0A813VPY5_9BILA|nr:unnamed protein product [Didymodactylos carnosus]CAF3630768.1 unnamed protein product [Didymodactylos carnosus]